MNEEKMREDFEATYTQFKWCPTADVLNPQFSIQLCWKLAWQAACASKQKEIDSWKIVAEDWRVKAVEWSRKNAEFKDS